MSVWLLTLQNFSLRICRIFLLYKRSREIIIIIIISIIIILIISGLLPPLSTHREPVNWTEGGAHF
jgi:hypothetical protein